VNFDYIQTAAINGTRIDGELAKHRADAEIELAEQKDALQRDCDHLKSVEASISQTLNEQAQTTAQVDAVIVTGQADLNEADERVERADGCKKAFQNHHSLPHDPIKPPKFLNVMIMSIMAIAEGFINASFFMAASMTATPTAALFVSFTFSAANILLSACGGFFIGRWLNYGAHALDSDAPEFRNARLRSKALFIVFLIVMFFFHLTIGLVRTQETLHAIEHSLGAYWELLHTPEAVLLVLIGVCLSVITYHKSKSAFADPYPNYSRHDNAVTQARNDKTDIQDELIERVNDTFDTSIDEVKQATKDDEKTVKAHNKAVDRCYKAHRQLTKDISQAESRLTSQATQLLDIYRGAGRDIEADFDLKTFCDFSAFITVDLPAYLPAPDRTAQIEQLNEAKVMALERLAKLISKHSD
jgi:hypothetical protein